MNKVSMQYMIGSKVMDLRIVGPNLTSTPVGIAVTKGNADLVKRLNYALSVVKSDGTMASLLKEYPGVGQ